MTIKNTTKGDLANALLKLKNSNPRSKEMKDLVALIESQEEFLASMAHQSTRAMYRQILKLKEDFFVSVESIKKAEENKVISEAYSKQLRDNFDKLEEIYLSNKSEALGYLMAAPSNGEGYLNYLSKAATEFNSFVQKEADESRIIKHSFNFDVKFSNALPEHRTSELLYNLLVFNFYKPSGFEMIRKEGGEETKEIVKFIPSHEAEDFNLDVKIGTSYDKKKNKITVSLDVINAKEGTNNPNVALMIDQKATAVNIQKAFETQYLVNSAIVVEDFASETALIDTLYVKPLVALLEQTLDENLINTARRIRWITKDAKKAITVARNEVTEKNKNNPFLEGYLSIVEDGVDSTQNKGEAVSRISKSEVIKTFFQGVSSKYENSAAGSKNGPNQMPLDRRFAIFRADLEDETVDFLIMEFGLSKNVIWLPIDKTFIANAQAIGMWNAMTKSEKKEIVEDYIKDGNIEQRFIKVSGDVVNPNIE